MEAAIRAVESTHRGPTTRQGEAIAQRGGQNTPAQSPLLFSEREVARYSELSGATLLHWRKRGWVVPTTSAKAVKRGRTYFYSAWQTVTLTIIAAVHRNVREEASYLGRSVIINAMDGVADLDDALLLSSDAQDRHDVTGRLAEQAAKIASEACTSPELPEEALENIARVVRAIDRKATALSARDRSAVRSPLLLRTATGRAEVTNLE